MAPRSIRPYRVAVPQADLDRLRERILRTRWAEELPAAGQVPPARVKKLVYRWLTSFDWRVQEARLNGFAQFTTDIGGRTVHFLHVRSAAPEATPLVLTHGRLGSVVEFLDMVGPLSGTHHVVAPSLPASAGGDGEPSSMARARAELMSRLGYERFGTYERPEPPGDLPRALADSPVGRLAWRMRALDGTADPDLVLATVTFSWLTRR